MMIEFLAKLVLVPLAFSAGFLWGMIYYRDYYSKRDQ